MKLRHLAFRSLTALALVGALVACQPPSSKDASTKADKNDTAQAEDNSDRLAEAQALSDAAGQGQIDVKVLELFDGPEDSGLVGLVIQPNGGGKEVAWANENMTVLFPIAIDNQGRNLNDVALAEQNIRMGASAMAQRILDEDIGFTVGKKGPVITAFMDPNCIFCHRFYNDVMPLVKDGKVRVRYIMVGLIRETSVPRSVAIMASKNPAKELDKDEKSFESVTHHNDDFDVDAHPEALEKVQRNNALLAEGGPASTPTLLVCRDGQDISIEQGQPQDIQSFVDSLDKDADNALCKG